MRFTLSWLKHFLDTDKSLEQITDTLTAIGLEVEAVVDRRQELSQFEVAYIISVNQHPNADKLKLCKVQTKSEILDIVCGAPNARAGIKVVLAKVGMCIPRDNFKLKTSNIRGEQSQGMMCSESELLIGSDADGIIELNQDAVIGESFIKHYGLDDPVIDIAITPNRADALGVYGVARDLAAAGIGMLKLLEIPTITSSINSDFTIDVQNQQASPLFFVREIRDVKNQRSPNWLKMLLQNIGIKSVSAIVDITNYICISFGQPIHVYDASKLSGKLIVKPLNTSITFTALDDKNYNLKQGDLVICDQDDNIHCLAGIIGSKISSCDDDTSSIILEAAYFNPKYIAKTGRRLQINTDARYRFERNVDNVFTLSALNIATNMILSVCSGHTSDVISDGNIQAQKRTLSFNIDFINKFAGFKIQNSVILSILETLGFQSNVTDNMLHILIPSWRSDVSIKEDIVEEILRIYGYDKLPMHPLPNTEITKIIPSKEKRVLDIKRLLAVKGYHEVVTWSFMDSDLAKSFALHNETLKVLNPINDDLDYMRPSIIPNLLKLIAKNQIRSTNDIAFFEIGPVFIATNPEDELLQISAVRTGNNMPKNCHETQRSIDVFDIKADVDAILAYIGLSIDQCAIIENKLSYYHPGRSAQINLGKNIIGHMGQIHPKLLKQLGIDSEVLAFEINCSKLPEPKQKFGKRSEYNPSDFQSNIRDFSFIIDINQNIGPILSYIKNLNKKLIKSVELFDIYQGNQLADNQQSILISVKIQSNEDTLTDTELHALSQSVISGIEQKFSGKLRSSH